MVPSEDKLTELLFRLPAELRNDIYNLCLPDIETYTDISDRLPQLRWLACSSDLFAEAASLLYSATILFTVTTLRGEGGGWPADKAAGQPRRGCG